VARARLLAEAAAQDISDGPLKAKTKIDRFYTELGVTPGDLNAGAALFRSMSQRATGMHPPEIAAPRAVADMVYHGKLEDYVDLPRVASLNFALDQPSSLKMKLAAMAPADRMYWLISDLADSKTEGDIQYFELQLAADYGIPAADAAIAKLGDMEQHRDRYQSDVGFVAMFQILVTLNYPVRPAVLSRFLNDPDSSVAYYAASLPTQWQFMEGY
jgi:hypothetical protein